jgi:hypothetical protein
MERKKNFHRVQLIWGTLAIGGHRHRHIPLQTFFVVVCGPVLCEHKTQMRNLKRGESAP